MDKFLNDNKILIIVIGVTFIITEIIDLYLDRLFGTSLIHSFFQILLFLILFIFTYFFFTHHYKAKIDILLPEDLFQILEIIKDAENKNIILNQKKFLSVLKITKPTMKKKIKILEDLNYISVEENGNYKYLKLTSEGKSLLK